MRRRPRFHVLLLRLTRIPRRVAAGLWQRARSRRRQTIALERVHRRLELLLAAMYGRPITIEMPEHRGRTVRERFARRARKMLRRDAQLPVSGGGSIALPETIASAATEADALARYRLLAVEQAERLTRGTPDVALLASSALERDLFLLAESAAAESSIARRVPGLRSTLSASRAEALSARPSAERLGGLERAVEQLVRRVLSADPSSPASEIPITAAAAESLDWARATAKQLSQSHDSVHYHGVKPVDHWGRVRGKALAAESMDPTTTIDMPSLNVPGGRMSVEARTSAGSDAQRSAEGESRAVEDARATGKAVRDDAPGSAESMSRSTLAEPSAAPLAPEDLASQVVDPYDAAPASGDPTSENEPGIPYDEWDHEVARYVSHRVIVRLVTAKDADERWSLEELAAHAAVVRRVRQRFERLRARRARLDRQRDGEELDIASCVRALVDRRVGLAMDDRLYASVRPARRALAITLLVDISGSTDAKVDDTRRIIDVERTSLLVASEALDALGDRYAIVTFSGRGARDVRLTTIKGFGERNGESVRRRIAAIEPQGNTRLGAAVRHATRMLSEQPAGHHLLLILSDGRPNDVDGYHEEYGVADTRQAVNEARAQGVYPFCLTVDRDAAEYLPHIFGIAGHSVLRDARQLPLALVKAVQQLLHS
jgi:nitric oxide reductase NorD protein